MNTKTPSKDHRLGVRKGYEDCAVIAEGVSVLWEESAHPGGAEAAMALRSLAKTIRVLKESL